MTRTLLESIQEAAAAILISTKTMSDDELADILDQDELREMETNLWAIVDMIQ